MALWTGGRPSDQELAPLKDVLGGLGTARVLTIGKAAGMLDLSPSAIRGWCADENDPVPHDHRPDNRPSRLLSESELFTYVLARPTVRDHALAALRARLPQDTPAAAAPPRSPTPGPEQDAGRRTAQPRSATRNGDGAGARPADDDQEGGRLRGEVVRLQEQVAHLTGLVEELEASNARKSALWLAAIRASSVPANAQGLDGLIPPAPPAGAANPR